MTTNITLLRLPHTGMRVPDSSLSVTDYQARPTDDGAWFKADLTLFGRLVGSVENDGNGGSTTLCSDPDHPIYGDVEVALAGYARRCRTEEGDRLGLEELLDELVAEHEWTLRIDDTAKKHRLLLRRMAFIADDFPPRPTADATSAVPSTPKDWTALRKGLTADRDFAPTGGSWWQAWHENHWRDATRRPAKVNPDYYG